MNKVLYSHGIENHKTSLSFILKIWLGTIFHYEYFFDFCSGHLGILLIFVQHDKIHS